MARILVVDDNADERLIYSALLHYHGHEVVEAPTGHAGVETARRMMPAVILMDVHLPDIDGLKATERLKGMKETSKIPIICVTGYDVIPSAARASGCVDLLRKPISPGDLIRSVAKVLGDPMQNAPAARQ